MGKRVFEVAKELGVDHRELLTKCDELKIRVRNYMSELDRSDEQRLRAAIEGGKSSSVDERVKPGVRVRRRPSKPGGRSRPKADAAADQTAVGRPSGPVGAGRTAQHARPVAPRRVAEPTPEATPAVAEAPVEVAEAKAPEAPAAEAQATEPKTSAPAETARTPQRARVLSRPDRPEPVRARVLSRPQAPARPAKPAAKVVKAPAKRKPVRPKTPPGDATKRRDLRPAHETLLRRSTKAEPEDEVTTVTESAAPEAAEPKAAEPKAEAPKPAAKPARALKSLGSRAKAPGTPAVAAGRAASEPAAPRAEGAPEATEAKGGKTAASASSDQPQRRDGQPARREGRTGRLDPSVTRRTGARPDKSQSQVRRPQARPKAAGGAKILGTIPLEQLQRRTRPPARSGPGPRGPRPGPGRGPARSGPGARGPGGPRFGGPPGASAGPLPPVDRGTDRRRRPGAAKTAGTGTDDRRRRGGGPGGAPGRSKRRVFNRDELYRGGNRGMRGRKRRMSSRKGAKTLLTTPAAHKRVVRVNGTISVGELGKALGVKAKELLNKLFQMGVMATINQQVDLDTASLIATDYDFEVRNVAFDEDAVLSGPVTAEKEEVDPDAVLRAPVVTIMGHVDHGKTTLLDRIRAANVAAGEAGGITQHIGAYRVETKQGPVVFLDTPGHAAFTSMRARGASVTDLVVLVVAADDGVMPQTVESINHARAAGVPLIIAINKVDKPGIDPERIKQELTKFELVPEEWGGETMMIPISALRGDGVDTLLESLALQAEVMELRANPKKPGFGRVVEARVEKGRGSVATVLVQEGTLKQGDYMVAGSYFGRVRALFDPFGKKIKSAGPSTPVEVLGLSGLPSAGEGFYTAKNEKAAKKVVSNRDAEAKLEADAKRREANPMDLLAAMGKKEREKQNIILKTDVSGSLEALRQSLEQLATDEVEVKLVHTGVGAISESDIDLASASDSTVIGFNVGPDNKAKRAADREAVKILRFSVIYDVLDSVKEMLSGLLEPETVEVALGKAEVRAVFHIQKVGSVAGSFVLEGKVVRNAIGRIRRGGELIYEGKVSTLKRFKDDVREVASGYECGLSVDNYKDVQVGDIIEVIELKQIRRTID